MTPHAVLASGRVVIDDFHERLFLFVHASTELTVDGQVVRASSLPETESELITRLREGLLLDGPRTFPLGVEHAPPSEFRILRVIDDGAVTEPDDLPHSLEHPGDSSRAVTIAGHISTAEEMSQHSDVTDPTITLEKMVAFEAIQQRAYDMFETGPGASPVDDWLRAEQALLIEG